MYDKTHITNHETVMIHGFRYISDLKNKNRQELQDLCKRNGLPFSNVHTRSTLYEQLKSKCKLYWDVICDKDQSNIYDFVIDKWNGIYTNQEVNTIEDINNNVEFLKQKIALQTMK